MDNFHEVKVVPIHTKFLVFLVVSSVLQLRLIRQTVHVERRLNAIPRETYLHVYLCLNIWQQCLCTLYTKKLLYSVRVLKPDFDVIVSVSCYSFVIRTCAHTHILPFTEQISVVIIRFTFFVIYNILFLKIDW